MREDRRHIQDRDVYLLKQAVKTYLNLEMALSDEIVKIALDVKPYQVTFVPEKREELTTEGGLDVIKNFEKIRGNVKKFAKKGIRVSLFIEPDMKQIAASERTGAGFIEIHTGRYADAKTEQEIQRELEKISDAAEYALSMNLRVNAGHGLDYKNTPAICGIKGIEELNIGYSIIGRAVFTGLENAVREMREVIKESVERLA